MAETNGNNSIAGSTSTGFNPENIYTAAPYEGGGGNPPDKPDGGGNPPDKPDGGGEGGGSEDTTTLTGVLQLDSGTGAYDGGEEGETLSSTTSDENVVLAQNSASLTLSNYTLNKSGDCSNADNSNFYAVNAVVAAKSAAKIYIDNSVLNSNAEGANGLFASGEGSTIYAYNCTITSAADSSRGLDATYEGTVIASKLTINTTGDHCAALATDRGDGYISVTDSTLETAGQGSPLIYSTGIIEADNVTGTSTGSQIAGIEGLSTIRIKNSDLSGSGKKASEPVANGVIIYQSMSGDSTEGTATFEVADSTLKSAINGGAMFYITNTEAVITVQNTVLDFDPDSNYLLKAAGNDGSNGWGTAGSNGADVIFTAINQTLSGTVSVDGISSLDMYLINSAYTGTFELDTTYTGDGGTDLYINADSVWTVTGSCTLQTLTAASGASIVDGNGETVSIVNTSGETIVAGTSDLTITVSAYTSATVETLYTINDFEIDRSAFEEMYAEEEPETDYDDRIVVSGTSTEPGSYTLKEGKTYTAAAYEGNGGAVYAGSYSTVTGKNVTFKNNSVTDSSGQGGAIYNGSDAVLNLTGAAFTGNNTTGLKGQGGAIYNGGTATIADGTISGNSATMGGAFFNNGGSLELAGGTISSNSAKYGGAIQNFGGGTVNITSAVFSGNTAAADGGAIAHNSGSMTITGTTFSGNTARSTGGAIYNASTLAIADATFSGNSAKTSGGAICNTGTVNMTGSVTLETESDDFYNTGTLNWDLTGGTASYGAMEGYQYLNNDGGTLLITVDNNRGSGSYTIATGDFSSLDGKETFTLTGIEEQSTITVNGESVISNDRKYTLATSDSGTAEELTDDKLILKVELLSAEILSTTTGNFTGAGGVFQLYSDGQAVIRTTDSLIRLSGTLTNVENWQIVGSGDFNGAGTDGLLWLERDTGYVYMQYDMSSISEISGKTNCLGIVGEGYSLKGAGDFSGTGIAGALLQGPAFGDESVSLNYGLPVWARESDGSTFNGWLGALVNTWQEGDALKGDLSSLKSINENNYRYEVVGVADFNGDGVDDVMLRNTMPETVEQNGTEYTITGSGDVFTFLTGSKETVKSGDDPTVCYAGREAGGWQVVGFGDFDGDGIDDALLSNGTDLAGWGMAEGQRQGDFSFGALAEGDELAGVADVNNDGTDDLIIRNTDSEALTAWTVKDGKRTGTLAIL